MGLAVDVPEQIVEERKEREAGEEHQRFRSARRNRWTGVGRDGGGDSDDENSAERWDGEDGAINVKPTQRTFGTLHAVICPNAAPTRPAQEAATENPLPTASSEHEGDEPGLS